MGKPPEARSFVNKWKNKSENHQNSWHEQGNCRKQKQETHQQNKTTAANDSNSTCSKQKHME